MTSESPVTTDDVVIGLLDNEAEITRGPWVAHPRPGFIGEADALRIHDTQQASPPVRKCATTLDSDGPSSFAATRIGASPPGPRLSPVATSVVSVIAALGLGLAGTLLVLLAAWTVDAGTLITIASVGSAGLSALTLAVAAVIGGRAR